MECGLDDFDNRVIHIAQSVPIAWDFDNFVIFSMKNPLDTTINCDDE